MRPEVFIVESLGANDREGRENHNDPSFAWVGKARFIVM